jgi:hypothetical protein
MNYLKASLAPIIICGSALLFQAPAHADLTTVMHTSMNMPQFGGKQMSAQMQAMMNQYSETTTFSSGSKTRVEKGMFTMIMDAGAKKMWMLNPMKHTYTVSRFTQDQFKSMMHSMSKSPAKGGAGMNYKVVDAGLGKVLLGHVTHHYIVKMNMTMMGTPMKTVEDIYAAPDIKAPMAAGMSGTVPEIHGYPLMMVIKTTGGPGGGTDMKMTVTSVKTTPVPASEFQIPAGYTESKLSASPR